MTLPIRLGGIWKFNGGTMMYRESRGVIGLTGEICHFERPQMGTIVGREERCMRHVNGQYEMGWWENGVWVKNMDIDPEVASEKSLLSRMEIEKYPEVPIESCCAEVKYDTLTYLRKRELGSRQALMKAIKVDHH